MGMKLTLLFMLLTVSVCAQNTIGIPLIVNYSKNDFRAGTQTWDIDQDNRGRMYFANNEGLVTFDGTFWKVHPLPNKTIVRSLAIAGNGRIYVGGQGELGYFFPDQKGHLIYESLIPLLPAKQKVFADIWDIEILGESVFFRASDRMIMELKNNNFSLYPPVSDWLFMKNVGGKLFGQDRLNGLYTFTKNNWIPFRNNRLLNGSVVSGMVPAGNDTVMLFTYDKKVLALAHDSLVQVRNFLLPASSFNFFRVSDMGRSKFVAGTVDQGCLIIDHHGQLIQKIARTEGLQNNNVLSVFIDKDQNLWAGLNNGISFIAYNSAFKYITPNKNNEVSGFSARIHRNQLYIGSSDGTYAVSLPTGISDLSFAKGDFSMVAGSYGQVWRLDEVNQNLLMAHNTGCYTISNNKAKQISTDPGWLFLPTRPVTPASTILTGTYTGLKKIEYKNGQFRDLGNLKGIYESLRFLTIDNDETIWASHPYRGIYRIELNEDSSAFSTTLFTDKDGLPSSLDNHVFKIKNRVVFGTSRGVYEYQKEKNKFIPSGFLTPIIGNTDIRYMNEDEEGNIWFCSGKKLGVIDFTVTGNEKPRVIYFSEINGQILSGFENVYPYNRENIFISSEKGIILLNYEKYTSNKQNLSSILGIVRATGGGDSIIHGGYSDWGKKAANLNLPSKFNSYHFEFSSPAFGLQKNIEYSFRLDGYDRKWSNWTNKAEKEYTNLSFGKYTFRVKARDNLGNESTETIYSFSIMAPWYRTSWAYVAYLLLSAGMVYAFVIVQRNKMLRQRMMYEEKERQMSIEYQLAMEKNEKEIIKLKNEKLEGEILLKTKELADTSMHLVERSDALLKVKEELQKLYKKSDENHDIKKTLVLLGDIEKNDASWEKFAVHFDEINNNFLKNLKLKYAKLTNSDLKLCAYLQLNLSSKEIAQLMNISVRGVEISRYRLRKKLGLPSEQSISDFLSNEV
jgi:ligand-binding sensor domain-containing protein/DNA-binding CsgD family transcriptional regulator